MTKNLIISASLIFVMSTAWISRTQAADPSLVGWWKFDEQTGTTAADSSGHGINGVLVNNPVWRQDGMYNGCLFFDGDQAHVRIANQDSLNPGAGSFTFTFWGNLDPAPGTQGSTNWDLAIGKRDTGSKGYYIGADRNQGSADQAGYRFMLGDINAKRKDTPFLPVQLGEWVFVTSVVDRDRNAQEISVDGGQTWASNTPPPDQVAPAQDLAIGWDIGPNNFWFHGLIDDVRIYNWALSLKEIQTVMDGGKGFPMARRPDPQDGAVLGATWANLSWVPGSFAVSHNLYFGSSFEDVNNGAADTFAGNLSTASQIVGITGFPAPDGLVPGATYYWRIDEVNDAEPDSPWKGDIWSFTVQSKIAYNPTPGDGARFTATDVTLSWTAGFGAKLHTVYFGDNFDDVSAASGGASLPTTTYDPGPLELGKTYYWRVDEFDAVTTHKGDIWSFTTRPAISIADPNLVGWWTFDEGYGTIALDWSGHENHATLINGPQWVEGYFDGALEFDGSNYVTMDPVADDITNDDITLSGWVKTTDTHGLWLSCNTGSRGNVALWSIDNGRAAMYDGSDSSYEGYSYTVVSDGQWHLLTYVRRGPTGYIYVDGSLENTHTAGYSFSATDLWSVAQEWDGGGPSDFLTGIVDDVRIYDTAMTQDEVAELMRGDLLLAWNPSPANRSTPDINSALPLSWSPGDNAAQHDVYFGTDKDAVANADASDTTGVYRIRQAGTSYTPAEGVEWGGGPYYWRIDEYNTDGTVSKGKLWSFSVGDFLTVDDFESYDDIDPIPGEPGTNRIFDKWIDGFGTTTNGALVGNDMPPYAERTVVHSGSQSMIYRYDNTGRTSEATLTLVYPRDWTEQGVTKLSLWLNGSASNAADRIYVALNGSTVVYHDDPAATLITGWNEWIIDTQAFAGQGVNLTNVNTITIGIGTKANPSAAGGIGTMYFDDIRLYR